MAAKPLSSSSTTSRPAGSERRQERQCPDRPAQTIGTSSIRPSQRRLLALTKWPWLERTGSR
jgi:hypothetical protein